VISGIYIFLTSGLPIFHTNLQPTEESMNQILFGGISSAISMLVKELAHSDLQSIEVEGGTLKYSIFKELIFVVHSRGKTGEDIVDFLLNQIKNEFIKGYEKILNTMELNVIDSSIFESFEDKVKETYRSILKLYESHENIFNFIPSDTPLSMIQDLLIKGDNLIEGFPDDTIRLVRILDDKYDVNTKKRILFSLGVYFGIEITKMKFPTKVSFGQDVVMKLLNEISVAKFDKKKRVFTLMICPICRGKKSNKPMCDFFAGFIEGCFDNPNLRVKEVTCKASGDKNCSYKLMDSRDRSN